MAVSLLFSTLIYMSVSSRIEHSFQRFQTRMMRQDQPLIGQMHRQMFELTPPPPSELWFSADITQAKQDLFLNLVGINLALLIIGSFVSYWLAGVSLRPLLLSVKQQKQFVSDASHELRTPITALRTSLEVNLEDPQIKGRIKTIMQGHLNNVLQLQQLVDSLLDLSRNHTIPLPIPQTQVLPIIDQVIHNLTPRLKAKHLTINNQVNPSTTADIHPHHLTQLFNIFLDNAIKFSSDKQTISIQANTTNKYTNLVITDHGQGILPEQLDHIFDRFYQAETARTTQQSGYGLGLAIAHQLVTAYHGKIEVSSTPGQGSTFTIQIPQA